MVPLPLVRTPLLYWLVSFVDERGRKLSYDYRNPLMSQAVSKFPFLVSYLLVSVPLWMYKESLAMARSCTHSSSSSSSSSFDRPLSCSSVREIRDLCLHQFLCVFSFPLTYWKRILLRAFVRPGSLALSLSRSLFVSSFGSCLLLLLLQLLSS